MSDPYDSNPYQSSDTALTPAREERGTHHDRIAALDVSETWKRRFRAIEAAGGPELPRFRELPFSERRRVQFNLLAFLLGPFYYLAKGLWRQAVVYVLIALAVILLLELAGLDSVTRVVGYGFAAVYAVRANIGYYKRMVLAQPPWL
ncbi:DUF2628 domain-containing protein [Flavobacterium sp. MXW15]|uniref:DUF2628 domain-containing protein n=1 Tax=Xanthomonas chitinilytica TaxID=2989819 RepID=A0ABT3JUA6_9XANT|nr:DUF2628 domain-containing protein [Xanthomonas sp. H13-6]MCW4453586.1 DUF2628 domain-containing protein [Flavobacterium sp. MXW15]MCW4472061.1 DUF2628 domain-containing protein [Xanthomonas sp. H13-6]